jgi:hypothetical protein
VEGEDETREHDTVDEDIPKEDMVSLRNADGKVVASSVVDDYIYRPVQYEHLSLYEWVQCSTVKCRTAIKKKEFKEEVLGHRAYLAELKNTDEDDDGDSDDMSDFIVNDDSGSDSDSEPSSLTDNESSWSSSDDDDVIVRKVQRSARRRKMWHPFISEDHSLFWTHEVTCDLTRVSRIVPNFMGGAVPRSDKGDRDYYCVTMMTLFKPWRSPADLKDKLSTWDQVFREHIFRSREQEPIKNFNLRYECNDARDDHYAEMKRKMRSTQFGFTSHFSCSFLGEKDEFANDPDTLYTGRDDYDGIDDCEILKYGIKTSKLLARKTEMEKLLSRVKWLDVPRDGLPTVDLTAISAIRKSRNTWAILL